jgi:hypothetical protein
MEAQIINSNSISFSFNPEKAKGVYRENFVGGLETLIEKGVSTIVVQGESGIGKTTVLSQLAKKYSFDSISYFANKLNKPTYNPDYVIEDIGRQVFFILKGTAATEEEEFTISTLNTMQIDLAKKLKRRKRIVIILDGLEQLPSNDFEQLKPVLENLPWDSPNASIVISGDFKKLIEIYPERINPKAEPIRIFQFTFEETREFFKNKITNIEQLKEIHDTWRGNPERFSDIIRIISRGISVEQFLQEDATEKNKLLDIEWQYPFNNIGEQWQFLAVAVVCFDRTLSLIKIISKIINIDYEALKIFYSSLSYLTIDNDKISFITTSIRDFASVKLKKYENIAQDTLVRYYMANIDQNALASLTGFYEKKTAWGKTIELLSIDNLSKIVNQSTSFSDIKSQIVNGYKAAVNYKDIVGIQGGFDNIFKFALYRSVFLELQTSDTREAEIQACVALKENAKAISIATSAFLKEDNFRMLIIFAKECKLRGINVDPIILEDIKSKYNGLDIDYLRENIVAIATDLAHTLPQLAIELVEKATENTKNNTSLEWLLTYLSVVNEKANKKLNHNAQDSSTSSTQSTVLDSFFSSVGQSNEQLAADEIKKDIGKFSNLSDKLYMIRTWIKYNEPSAAVFDIMHLALDLVLENSSIIKPSTTILVDISHPIAKSTDNDKVSIYLSRINALLETVNTPTEDLIKLEIIIIEALLKTNLQLANKRLFKLLNNIKDNDDVSIRAEAYARIWYVLQEMIANGFQAHEIIYRIEEAKSDLEYNLNIIFSTIAYQERDLDTTLSIIAKKDLKYSIHLAENSNTLNRKHLFYVTAIESYSENPLNEWDIATISTLFRRIKTASIIEDLVSALVDSAYKQIQNTIDGRHNLLQLLPNIEKIENNESKCILLIKSVAIFIGKSKSRIGYTKNYPKVVEKLKSYLYECWHKIENPWAKVAIAFKISSIIASYDNELASQYYTLAKGIEENIFVDNYTYASILLKSLSISINTYAGALKCGLRPDYTDLEFLIDKINSPLEQVFLWSKFAVKAYLSDARDICERIVASKILPVLDAYIVEKKDALYLNLLILNSASAIFLAQKAQLMLLLNKLPIEYKELVIDRLTYVLLNHVGEDEPYDSTKGNPDVRFQDISDVVELAQHIEDDNTLYDIISKVTEVVKENPLLLTREQKNVLRPVIKKLIQTKLPNTVTGIKHEGYVIVSEAALTQLDTNFVEAEYTQVFKALQVRAEAIPNISDRALILSSLSSECQGKLKRLRQDLLEAGFKAADQIPSYREKFDRYLTLLNTAKDVSDNFFSSKIKEINKEIFSIDSKDLFPTHRRLIDLAFKHDKALAERLISVLDSDPARKALTFPASKHLDEIKLERDAIEDYSKFSQLKSRRQIGDVAWKNLGQLNADKRMTKTVEQSTQLLPIAAKTPLYYSFHVFNLFINNIVKKGIGNTNLKAAIQNMYIYSVHNSQLTYDIVCSLSLKKSYIPTNFISKSNNDTFSVKPGQKQAAIEFIVNFFAEAEYSEIFVIDSYISEKDTKFLRAMIECNPSAQITVMTSLEGSKGKTSIDRPAFIQEWKNISDDPLPNMTVIRANKADQTSPFHDRYIIAQEANLGLQFGSSINSIGGGKVFGITVMSSEQIKSVYESTIEPFAHQRVKIFGKDKIKYESFDLG